MLETTPSGTLPAGPTPRPVVGELDLDNLAPGLRWRGRYLVQHVLPDNTHGKTLSASQLDNGQEVTIRSFRVPDDGRARAWVGLDRYKGKGITTLIESAELDGRRVEVLKVPGGCNVTQWLVGRKLTSAELKRFIAQLADVVAALHEQGVVHLNLCPDTVFLEPTSDGPQVVLGGLETATDTSRSALISINVNPFYAPPDAVGLYQHQCGPTLRAWDWWSFGRLVQEMVLGSHVLGLILGRDVSRHTPELLMRADQFLREQDSSKARAGGVEAMPTMAPELMTLLRGLLASAREARWGADEVRAWLRGENVKERYHLPRHERLFIWKDHAYAISEAAEMFSESTHWSEGVAQIFEANNSAALINFLADDGASHKTADWIHELVKLPDSATFAHFPTAATRDVVTAIVWAILGHGVAPLRLRGRKVDAALLGELLRPEAQPEGLSVVQTLIEETAIKQIALVDADTSRFLSDFAHAANGALLIAETHRWLSWEKPTAIVELFAQALVGAQAHRQALSAARNQFAVSRDDAVDRLFNHASLNESQLAVVNWTLETPEEFRYVTHEIWSVELYSKLQDEGGRVIRAEGWFKLSNRLRLGFHLLGFWIFFTVIWFLASASVALAYPSRMTLALAILLFVSSFSLRTINRAFIGKELRLRSLGQMSVVKLSVSACEEAGRLCVPEISRPSQNSLHQRWVELNNRIQKLRSNRPLASIPPSATFSFVKFSTLFSGAVLIAVAVMLSWHVVRHPPSWPILKAAWFQTDLPSTPGTALGNDKAKSDDEEYVRKIAWDFRATGEPQNVRIVDVAEATPKQNEEALKNGALLVRSFRASTIDALIAVRVPLDDGIGLMLYDGKAAKLAEKHLFKVGSVPTARSWIQLGDRRIFYLGDN